MSDHFDVVVIGAGAAGVGADLKLASAGVAFTVLDARDRIGGRALTVAAGGHPLDLGCGGLHSAERNVLSAVGEASGFHVDRTPAPWQRQSCNYGLTGAEQEAFARTFSAFEKRIDAEADGGPPLPASADRSTRPRWLFLRQAGMCGSARHARSAGGRSRFLRRRSLLTRSLFHRSRRVPDWL